MPTDDERREVARRLLKMPYFSLEHVAYAIGYDEENDDWDEVDVINRLADLIEPGEPKVKCVAEVKVDGEQLEKLVHDAVVEYAGVDREALLELADEIRALNENAEIHLFNTVRISDTTLLAIERRIREAIGA